MKQTGLRKPGQSVLRDLKEMAQHAKTYGRKGFGLYEGSSKNDQTWADIQAAVKWVETYGAETAPSLKTVVVDVCEKSTDKVWNKIPDQVRDKVRRKVNNGTWAIGGVVEEEIKQQGEELG